MRLTVTAERAALHGDCVAVTAIGKRVYDIDPAYHAAAFRTNAVIVGCRQGVQLDREHADAMRASFSGPRPDEPRFGSTNEIAIGAGIWTSELFGESLEGIGGPGIGLGGMITPRFALSFRIAGALHVGDGFMGYLGTVGPNVQYWVGDRGWVGGGIGIGVLVACGGGECEGEKSSGMNLRAGYAFKPRGHSGANVSFEMTSFRMPWEVSLKTYSLLIGYQSF